MYRDKQKTLELQAALLRPSVHRCHCSQSSHGALTLLSTKTAWEVFFSAYRRDHRSSDVTALLCKTELYHTPTAVTAWNSPVEMWWRTVTHGRGSKGETGEWSGQPVLFTLARNMVYPGLLPLIRTYRLPVVDWTDAPRWLKWTRPFRRKTKSGFCTCAITFQKQSNCTDSTDALRKLDSEYGKVILPVRTAESDCETDMMALCLPAATVQPFWTETFYTLCHPSSKWRSACECCVSMLLGGAWGSVVVKALRY